MVVDADLAFDVVVAVPVGRDLQRPVAVAHCIVVADRAALLAPRSFLIILNTLPLS